MEMPGAPLKRFAGVDAEIEAFEDSLWRGLEFLLIVNLDRSFWEEVDEIDLATFNNISTVVDEASVDLRNQYVGTDVIPILDLISLEVKMIIRSGMYVPFPRDPDRHMDCVIHNAQCEMYVRLDELRQAMLRVNHHAHLLQRSWRRVITDPSHLACRRRLDREFEDSMQALHDMLEAR